MQSISFVTAFFAGLVSFVSPCVLSLVPAYLSFISGMSVDQMQREEDRRKAIGRTGLNALAFVLGFSLVFVLLGASATFLGQFLRGKMAILNKVAGAIVVLFGLHIAGVFRIRFLDYEKRFHPRTKSSGLMGAFFVGMAFAFGWTPCIGPFLAAILAYAAIQETVAQGIVLLGVYALGLGIPFLLTGLVVHVFFAAFDRIKRHFRTIEIASGMLLILVGLLIFTDNFQILASYLSRLSG